MISIRAEVSFTFDGSKISFGIKVLESDTSCFKEIDKLAKIDISIKAN